MRMKSAPRRHYMPSRVANGEHFAQGIRRSLSLGGMSSGPENQEFPTFELLTATVGWPAFFLPMMPSDITLTFWYPAFTARRAASWEAIQSVFAQ